MPTNGPSETHAWLLREGRRLEIESNQRLLHRFCTTCRRSFVCDLATDDLYAAFPRAFDFERLDEVSKRWLNESSRPSFGFRQRNSGSFTES